MRSGVLGRASFLGALASVTVEITPPGEFSEIGSVGALMPFLCPAARLSFRACARWAGDRDEPVRFPAWVRNLRTNSVVPRPR